MEISKHALTTPDREIMEGHSATPMVMQRPPMWVDAGARKPGLASYLEIPFMHKRLIVVCTLLGILFGWLAILVWPRSYESEARLMMRVGRESVSLDPTLTTSQTMSVNQTREDEITSALEVLGSRQIAQTVVDKLGENEILAGVLPGQVAQEKPADRGLGYYVGIAKSLMQEATGALNSILLYGGIKDDIGARESAIRKIQSSVKAHSSRNSTVIRIEGRAKSPAMAQAIVENVTESFLDEQLDGSYTGGSLEFFRQQAGDVENQLNALVRARSDYMQEHKIVSIEINRTMLQEQLSGISRDLVVAYGAVEQAVAEAKDLITKNDQSDDEIVAQRTEVEDNAWSGMRQQIYELELEEQRASAVYTEDHPHLVRVRKQLEGAHKILAGQESGRVALNTTPNPVKIDLENQLQLQQTTIVGLESAINEKEKRVAEMQLEIDRLLEHERHLLKVDRDVRLMEDNLVALEEKLEEARVLDDLHSEKISAINVFQPATFVERAVRPEKKTLAAGFVILGLTTGLFLSVLRQGSSTTLRTSEDVESQLGCPVVTTIPRLSRMKSPYLKDRRLYRQKCQAVIADVLLSRPHPSRSRGRSLGVISVEAGAGASTLAMNLAITSSDDCRIKTVLADADFRRRSISKMFGLNGTPGLVELVGGIASHDECLQTVKDSRVELVASAADSCDEILSGSAPEIIQALQAYVHDCDLLIVDLPAADQPDQAVALAQHLDSVLVVVESEKTETAPAERLLRRLLASDTEVVGVVLNKTNSYLPKIVRSFVAPQV